MKRVLIVFLAVLPLFSGMALTSCDSSDFKTIFKIGMAAWALIETIGTGGSSGGTGTTVDNPSSPSSVCDCSKSSNQIFVNVIGGPNMDPAEQYAFAKLMSDPPWTSEPIPYGPGEQLLSISGIPNTEIRTELIVAFTDDYEVAQSGDISRAAQIRKVLYTTGECDPERTKKVHYDCMQGRDIRGPLNNGEYNTFRECHDHLKAGDICIDTFFSDQTALADIDFASDSELDLWLLHNWNGVPSSGWTPAVPEQFYLAGVKNATNRGDWFLADGSHRPLDDSTAGFTTSVLSPYGDWGEYGNASVVFQEYVSNLIATPDLDRAYWQVALHELGHATANLKHPWVDPNAHTDYGDSHCVMQYLIFDQYHRLVPHYDDFCRKCKENMKSHTWVEK